MVRAFVAGPGALPHGKALLCAVGCRGKKEAEHGGDGRRRAHRAAMRDQGDGGPGQSCRGRGPPAGPPDAGRARGGRALRRSKLALRSQQVAAVVVMPLAIAAFVVSSSPQRPILVQAKSPPGATVQSLPRTAGNPLPGPSASPVPTPAAVARVPAAQLVAVTTAQNRTMAEPTALPPPPSDLDHDRGKGRDRDDSVQKPRHHGKARGHDH